MVQIRVCQVLCPARHAILGMGLSPETMGAMSDDDARTMLKGLVDMALDGKSLVEVAGAEFAAKVKGLNAHCGLCGAPAATWTYEVARSRPFADWNEAQSFLLQSEREQGASRDLMNLFGLSHDAQRKRDSN